MNIRIASINVLFSLFLLFSNANLLYAQNSSFDEELERLERKLPQLSGKEKLDTLTFLVNSTMPANPAKGIPFIKEMEKEAILQNDIARQSGVKNKMVEYYFYCRDNDSIFIASDIAEEFNRKHKLYDKLFNVQQIVVQAYHSRGDYANAIKKAKAMYEEAKEIGSYYGMANASAAIANVYNAMFICDEAMNYYKEAMNLLTHIDNTKEVMMLRLNILHMITDIYSQEQEVDSLLAFTESMSMIIDEYAAKYGSKLSQHRLKVELNRSRGYLYSNNPDMAYPHIQKSDSLYELFPMYAIVIGIYDIKSNYYLLKKDYENALVYFKKQLDYLEENDFEDWSQAKARWEFAYTLKELGRYDEAIVNYEKACVQMDNSYHKDQSYQLNHLRTMYDVDKLELQAEKDKLQLGLAQNKIIAFTVVSVLLLAIIVIVVCNMHRIRKKNIGLVLRIREQDLLEEKIAQQQEELDRLRILQNEQEPESQDADDSQGQELIGRLRIFLKDNPVYTDASINRKSLARMIGTNENYLRTAIKEQLGYTFNEYMNELRLKCAKNLMSSSSDYTIEEIAMASGFNTRSTLYRKFREKYGVSPDEYRKLIKCI